MTDDELRTHIDKEIERHEKSLVRYREYKNSGNAELRIAGG